MPESNNLELALLVQQRRLTLDQIPEPQRTQVHQLRRRLSDAQLGRLALRAEQANRHRPRSAVHSR